MHKNDFQAGEGCFKSFKKRFGMKLLSSTGEKFSSDECGVEPYKEMIQKNIQEVGLTPDQVYNATESGLFW